MRHRKVRIIFGPGIIAGAAIVKVGADPPVIFMSQLTVLLWSVHTLQPLVGWPRTIISCRQMSSLSYHLFSSATGCDSLDQPPPHR
jgi:hypothetical protein